MPQSTCSIAGCDKDLFNKANLWCRMHYRLWKAYGKPEHKAPRPTRICTIQGCGNKYRTGGYCSNHHEYNKRNGTPFPPARQCTLCGDEFATIQTKQKLCEACRYATANARHGVRPQALAERDGTDCKLCGDPVDMELKFPDLWSPSVDHVIPWSLGGTHDPDNLQLAHLTCNCRKGNRVELAVA